MNDNFGQNKVSIFNKLKDLQFQFYKFWNVVWPINWLNIKDYKLVSDSIKNTSNSLKAVLSICVAGTILANIFLMQGFYLILTVETSSSGGEFNEAIYAQNFNNINPLLSANNDTERKIVNLIYQPLYRVVYPDFLNSTQDLRIEPVLLKQEPKVIEKDGEKSLILELKPNLKWSDNSPLTAQDVAYSFDRLKEANGNSDFRDILANYRITIIDNTNLQINIINKSKGFNPQLKYLLNFYPVSKNYFEEKNLDLISKSPKSIQNQVSSGQYIIPVKVKIDGKETSNPIAIGNGSYSSIVLDKNINNSINPALIQRYIIKVYPDLRDVGGVGNQSLERASITKKVDLFTRFLSTGSAITSQDITDKFQLSQKIVPTNTFYTLYANTQAGQWLINTSLRKYILCAFENFELQKNSWAVDIIPNNKKFLPIQFNSTSNPNCANAKLELLDQKSKSGKNTYTTTTNDIMLDGKNINLNILAFEEMADMTKELQSKLDQNGIKSYLTLAKDSDDLEQKIANRSYNLVFLPTTIISRDIYPLFGAKSRNIASLNKNNRIGSEADKFGEGIEKLIKEYSESELVNQDQKNKLIEIFGNEFIAVNLFRAKHEINYSPRLRLTNNSFDSLLTFSVDIQSKLPNWFLNTRRKFRWL